jgi:type I restriction enzyme M protein
MIVECKQPKRSDGQRQLEIYLDLCSATIGVWFNGDEHVYLQKYVTEKGINAYREIPLIPLNGQRIEDIGKFYRRDLKASLNLRSVFKDIRNHIAGHTTGVTRDEAIAGEIINLLFCKIYDEINTAPDEIVKFRYGINEPSTDVAVRIKGLFVDVKKDYRDVFQETDAITLDDKTIAYVVGELQRYCITEAERDVIGEAFEVFIGPALKGSQGQFFTPRNIVRTAIEIVNPSPTDRVLDPACGSGGFLIVALEHVWRKLSAEAEKRGLGRSWLRTREDAVATNNFRGIEKDSFLAKITKAYMAIVGDGRGGIVCENSLLRSSEWPANVQQAIQEDFDVIFTNPPFGAKIMITDYDILKHYDLGHKWKRRKGGGWDKTSQALKKQPPQILFIERCLQLLKPGGTLAIILPDGILGGAKIGYVPHFINEKFETVALVDCPLESFSPNTTTKVHLLVLRKRVITRVQVGRRIFQEKKASPTVKDVFMSVPQIVGHDKKGHTIYLDPKNQIVRDDLEITKARWNEFKAGKKVDDRFGFTIEISELEESLNAKRYLPMFMDVVRRIRKSTMAKKTLGDIALVLRTGANVDNLDYVAAEDGVPYILVKNVLREGIVFSNLKHIKKATAADFGPAIAEENDIIINRCGDTGIAAIVPKDLAGAVVCGFCFRLKVRSGYNPNYIAAFLNSKLGSLQLKRLAIGSILEHITKDDLKTVEIVFPKTDEEIEAIASRFAQSTTYRQLARKEMDDAAKDIVDALAKH